MGTAPDLRWDFTCGRPAFADFPHAVWARLIRRRAVLVSAAELDYAPAAGLPELRAAIAAHLSGWRGVVCTPEQVVITNGSQQALGLVAALVLDPGQAVALEEPHYAGAPRPLRRPAPRSCRSRSTSTGSTSGGSRRLGPGRGSHT
jgi:GntR family transcriptional regulator/MocR family aminotransferase